MKLRERYRRLTLWNRVAFWGSIASIISIPVAVVIWLIPSPTLVTTPIPSPTPTKNPTIEPEMITIDTYSISKYEITNKEYRAFLSETGYQPRPALLDNPEFGDDLQPVVFISWKDAMAYCQWLSNKTGKNYSLPTELQWKKAAGCDEGKTYPWGEGVPDKERIIYGGKFSTPQHKSRLPIEESEYRIRNMAGNVAEWCQDSDKKQWKIYCGGSWKEHFSVMECDSRRSYPSGSKKEFIGFRVIYNH